ncbi:50S ribosomal protein-like protein L24 [Plenodomus tracheiphilus IPT5]|uniref:Large ribosomal subunit protein bL28m n=1 Tax=Plenodomus tracheiphilus IPT5 TaxID=1408161 RepID=A0A6A7AXM1_9PLEO|nr:50S ribosomal protein-like protein L24 [Plenodomus tracheiphilus IPT5]
MPPRYQLLTTRISVHRLAIRTAQSSQRTYATESDLPEPVVKNPIQRRKGGDLGSHLPKHIIPQNVYIPAYPYGDYQLYKQANKGLYADQMIQFGNNVSRKTETKTRRVWKPNVLSKSLYSIALKKKIKLRVTANVLKTIDREGGLDEYLLKDSQHRIKELGPLGWALRWTLMQTPEVIARLRADAAALGVDQATIDKQWPSPKMVKEQREAPGAVSFDYNNDVFAETEGKEMWDPEDSRSDGNKHFSRLEKEAAADAAREYNRAVIAAKRYLERRRVESIEAGIKLAYIRAKEREEATTKSKTELVEKLNAFTDQELKDLKLRLKLPAKIGETQLRKIAYNQRRRQLISEAGGYEAWKEARQAEWKASNMHVPENPDVETLKAEYAKQLEEAETAATNQSLSAERREYLVEQMNKADRAIRANMAGGIPDYITATLQEKFPLESRDATNGNDLSGLTQGEGADAWGAVLDASKKPEGKQPNL